MIFSLELIKATKHCNDYVILHELIHFKYNNHSEKFYNMLYSFIPDWGKMKVVLDEEIVRDI
ncbi:M48 metallopeptidase family protein [Chengkuizengella axinellae]|uniref:M48 family metallopeptidase n=1 Tax=Chengkuizengella axinellae TaxID=3064388 RepID=A0ABT9IZ24_9BACL|nr:M48 family metallopeptidase [Chengkuizengella sp. 2205SS18-9]MDP5274621.1 M48 family metallopeptidase [Chengkuizengella sp. 2205SS18-9]